MNKYLSLSIGGTPIEAPKQIPTGGLSDHVGQNIIARSITLIMVGVTLLALFALIFAGFQWLTSGGDSKKIEGARNRIIQAIIGLGIVFLAFFIINIIGGIFNIQLLGL